MALDCYCLRLFSFQFQQLSKQMAVHNMLFSQHVNLHLRKISSTLNICRTFNKQNLTISASGIFFVSLEPHIRMGRMGLKYQSNHRRYFVKEVKRQGLRLVKGNEVVKDVRRAILDKQHMLRQTEERWKNNSKLILADIKETKSKMKVKMEEIVERENVWTIPNLLCVSRIAMSPVLGYLILEQDFHYALGLLTVAGVTDLLDGWIARTFENQSSKLGSFLDPMADKILIATMFLTLTYAGIIPVPLTVLIITRDVALVSAGFIIRYKSLPPPKTLSRYFDVTHATAQLAPTFISKVNTMVQLVTVAATLAAPVFGYLDHIALHSLWYITAGTTVASAGSYLLSKNTFKFLKRSKE